MSEYTREEILKLIEENGGPEGFDISDHHRHFPRRTPRLRGRQSD